MLPAVQNKRNYFFACVFIFGIAVLFLVSFFIKSKTVNLYPKAGNTLLPLTVPTSVPTLIFEPSKIFGKIDFTETVPNQVVANRVFHPQGVTVDRKTSPNRIYVWDSGNSRILGFSSLGRCTGGVNINKSCTHNLDCPSSSCQIDSYKKADIIIGQKDEFYATCNDDNTKYTAANEASLCSIPYPYAISLLESPEPNAMAVDANNNLYVYDKYNSRVLKYIDPFQTDRVADQIWGQANFKDRSCNQRQISPSAGTLCAKRNLAESSGDYAGAGVDVDPSGNVWVSDGTNNRVLRFPQNSKVADLVIGQSDFTSSRSDACIGYTQVQAGYIPTILYLCRPNSVRYDPQGKQLFVIDWPNPGYPEMARVLVYKEPFTSGMPAAEVLNGSVNGKYPYNFNRPIGLEVDPFTPQAFWIQDWNNHRVLFYQKINNTWIAKKVIGQPNTTRTGCGGFTDICPIQVGPPWMCETCHSAGGVGIDSAGNVYISDLLQQQIMRFPRPPDAPVTGGVGHSADAIILRSQDPSSYHVNLISAYGINNANAVLLADYIGGQKQLFIGDHFRVLFWNDYKTKGSGSPADGVLFQENLNTQLATTNGIVRSLDKDENGHIFIGKGDQVYIFNGPVVNRQQPSVIIPATLPLRFGGTITNSEIIGIAYDAKNDALWIADTTNHRVVRISKPMDATRRIVDLVLGQPNLSSTEANRGVDIASQLTCPNVIPDGFGNLGLIKLDRFGNLYIVDATHEGWQCSNNRVVEYDAVDLIPDPSKNFFANRERVPKRVYTKPNFYSKINQPADYHLPNTPISISFTKENKMLMTTDAYDNLPQERIFIYDNPLPVCSSPCSVAHSAIVPLTVSQPEDASWDNNGSLALLDHTWNRVLYFSSTPLTPGSSQTPPPNPSITHTSTITSTTTPSPNCPLKPQGDANCDGKITLIDFEIWRREFTGATTTIDADFSGDNKVTLVDFEIWRRRFTQSTTTVTPTLSVLPSPTSFPLLNADVVLVSDFTNYPVIRAQLEPLLSTFQAEGRHYTLIDLSNLTSQSGRDTAEKLRNILRNHYNVKPFRYLFLLDVLVPNPITGDRHILPSRIFYDNSFFPQPMPVWNDYYYTDLFGEFDTNHNGQFELHQDYNPGPEDKKIVVGRLLFNAASLEQELNRYIAANLSFRKNPKLTTSLVVKHREPSLRTGSSIHWPTGDGQEELETLFTSLAARNIQNQVLVAPEKDKVLQELAGSDLVYFWGHGAIQQQQIKATDLTNDAIGVYLYYSDLINAQNLTRPKFMFFQGCETGGLFYHEKYPDCLDATVCSASQTIAGGLLLNHASSTTPALAAVANSISTSFYPSDFANLLEGASFYNSLATTVSSLNWRIYAHQQFGKGRLSLAYFGDPTLPFPILTQSDSEAPKIEFNTTRNAFAAVDNISGVAKVELSWDQGPFNEILGELPQAPHYLPTNKVFYENHALRIRVYDRSGNVGEQTQHYPRRLE